MVPDNKPQDITEITITTNSRPVVFGADGRIPFVELSNEIECDIPDVLNPGCLSMTFRPPRGLRRVSRKRFVKLLMSYGMMRNWANRLAMLVRQAGEPYQHFVFWLWLSVDCRPRRKETIDDHA